MGIRLLRFVSRLAVLLVVGGLVVARSSSAGSSNSEPLDYQSNPHSAKYDFSEVDAIVDVFLQRTPTSTALRLQWCVEAKARSTKKGTAHSSAIGFLSSHRPEKC